MILILTSGTDNNINYGCNSWYLKKWVIWKGCLMFYSPLRYPGGKGKITPLIADIINNTGHAGGTYIEPFAGGAGVALELLETNIVSDIVINDLDKGIYSFWRAILTENDRFVNKIKKVDVNINEWERQRHICLSSPNRYSFDLGFATFFLNRTNRSGIIKGGVIGGKEQTGDWRLDARFNKIDLINRIESIGKFRTHIHLYNKEIESFLINYVPKYGDDAFVYFDPPYFQKGKQLYLNYLEYGDHERIASLLKNYVKCDWVLTYDDAKEIRSLYKGFEIKRISLNYCAANKCKAKEIMIRSKNLI